MIGTLRRSGNSIVVTIPPDELDRVGAREGDYVDVQIRPVEIRPKVTPEPTARDRSTGINSERSSGWTKWRVAATLMDKVGAQLATQYGGSPIPSKAIREAFEREGMTEFGRSVSWFSLPSDYCYNCVNRGQYSMSCPIFIRDELQPTTYHYAGLDSPNYTGPVWWTEKGRPKRQVGSATKGHITLSEDPRR